MGETTSASTTSATTSVAPGATHGTGGFSMRLQQLKDFKELALIAVFFGSGILWVVNYFATRHELDAYKCVNNLTVAMLVSAQTSDFLDYQIRTARKDLRDTQELLERQAPYSETYKNLARQLDEQKASLDKLKRGYDDADRKKAEAFAKLQAIQPATAS